MESNIRNCKIDYERNAIDLYLDNSETITIFVNVPHEDPETLACIDLCNRKYCAFVYERNLSGPNKYGILNTQVVNLREIPLTLIPPKYILNVFLKIFQCLFKDNKDILKYFDRDEKDVDIPISSNEISALINDIMKVFQDTQKNNSMDIDNDDDDDDDDEETIIDIRDIFAMIIEYIMKLHTKNQSMLENNESVFRRKANMVGRINNEQINKNLKTDFDRGLYQAGEMIHNLISQYNKEIYKDITCKEKIDYVINCISNDPNKCIYVNTRVSFKFMMDFISEIFKKLFTDILPKTSMLDSLYGILYQAAFLREMNILEHYSNIIHLPLMYRIIYSFYKDESSSNDNNYEEYLKSEYSGIYRLINQLNNNDDDDDIPRLLSEIASKCNIQETKMLDSLYWVLNEKRNYTFEFYLIIIIIMYMKAKCATLNARNKISNTREFIQPIYNLINLFRNYIKNDIKDKNVALCTNTFDNFNRLYASDIKRVVKSLYKNIQK